MTTAQTEAWQRGPVPGFDPLLMPVVHALIQAREDLDRLIPVVPPEHVWSRPGNAASLGFHVRHAGGALDRLFTYARGEGLSDAQRAALQSEGDPGSLPQRSRCSSPTRVALSMAPWRSCGQRRANRSSTTAESAGPVFRRPSSGCCFMPPNTPRATSVRR